MGEWIVISALELPPLLAGTLVTLQLVAVSLVLGTVVGLSTALVRVYGSGWTRAMVIGYVEVFRGTPLLVQLFMVYYGLPDIGIVLPAMTAACLTMSLNSGAYQSDYFRGGVQAVGSGQMMAARALGMSRLKAIVHIILPQAVRLLIPSWSLESSQLLKASAVTFLITVPDAMGQAKILVTRTFNALPTYLTITGIYIGIVAICSLLFGLLERKARIPGWGTAIYKR